MQKQKQLKNLLSRHDRSEERRVWTEDNFTELYPHPPSITTSSTYFVVGINYRGTLLKVKIPTGVRNESLPYLFHFEIYKYLLNMKDSNPILKTAQVVGFESVDQDLLLDYQLSIGKGNLERKVSFNCLEYVAEGRLKKYKICKCLAIGGFSKVYLVRSLRDGQFYAMKVMLKRFISENQKESIIQNQKAICSTLNHPFIVKLNHCFQTHNFVCFVLDYCPGGQLFYYLKSVKRMEEEEAKFYFVEILYGLMYLHQQNIIYRDLKPQNLLINHDGHIKIADFGLSKATTDNREQTYSFCGSTEYMPPEMILKQGHSFSVDFYTLGALLYELVTGLPPFYSRDEEEIKESILHQELTFPDHVELSSQIKQLLTGLLNKNPKLRLGSYKGLKEVLFHPWLGKINSQVVLGKKLVPPYLPSAEEFNFDENQLGDDQAEFTQTLLNQHLILPARQKLIFKDFDFNSQRPLRAELNRIYEVYRESPKRMMTYSSSKSLKKALSKPLLKKQSSSPYLTVGKEKLKRGLVQGRNKSFDQLQPQINHMRSWSKKKISNTSYLQQAIAKNINLTTHKKQKENNPANPFLKKKKRLRE